MGGILGGIDVTNWVRGAARSYLETRGDRSWSQCWSDQYFALGGLSTSVARKGCPMAATFALLQAGYLECVKQPASMLSVGTVCERHGKNGAYAVIAAELLLNGSVLRGAALWQQVRELFRRETRQEPAISQQGAVTVVEALFRAGQLRRPVCGAA